MSVDFCFAFLVKTRTENRGVNYWEFVILVNTVYPSLNSFATKMDVRFHIDYILFTWLSSLLRSLTTVDVRTNADWLIQSLVMSNWKSLEYNLLTLTLTNTVCHSVHLCSAVSIYRL